MNLENKNFNSDCYSDYIEMANEFESAKNEMLFSVDCSEPITWEEFVEANKDGWDEDEFLAHYNGILNLKVDETYWDGMHADVKRIA